LTSQRNYWNYSENACVMTQEDGEVMVNAEGEIVENDCVLMQDLVMGVDVSAEMELENVDIEEGRKTNRSSQLLT
jgi:hypothetical protein